LKILPVQEVQSFWEFFYKISPNGAAEFNCPATEAALKIGVVNLDVLEVIKECQLLQDSYHLEVEAHGGLGHGLCHVSLKGLEEDIVSAIHYLRDTVEAVDGYVIAKHLPFSLRQRVNVWGDTPAHFFLLEGIKKKVDPNHVLNHRRFVGGI